MAKYTLKEIKDIQKYTPDELRGKQINTIQNFYCGCYIKTGCNWAYQVYVVLHNKNLRAVVVTFGTIA